MAHFYGSVKGSRGEATRLGGKDSGLVTIAASYSGAVKTELFVDDRGVDCARVTLIPWRGAGASRQLYEGPVKAEAGKK